MARLSQTAHNRMPIFAAALWWGSLTLLGAVVVPLLFMHLPTPAMAGTMAAKLFTAQTWVSTVCGLLLLLFSRNSQESSALAVHAPAGWIMAGTLLALLLEFAVAPRIVSRENLALWHSLGSAFYVLQWLSATVTLWQLSDRR